MVEVAKYRLYEGKIYISRCVIVGYLVTYGAPKNIAFFFERKVFTASERDS